MIAGDRNGEILLEESRRKISGRTGTDWHGVCTASENHECSGKNSSGEKSISEISAGIRCFCKEISDI